MPIESVADEAVNEEMDDRLVRVATTASSLEAEHQDIMRDAVAQTRSERVSKISNDPLLIRVNTPQSGEDILKLNELMDLCTNLQNMVLALEATKTTQAQEIDSLKRRVKKLEKKQRSRTYKLKRLYKVGLSTRVESSDDEGLGEEDASKQGRIIDYLDADEYITLMNDQEMLDADKDLQGKEVVVEQKVVADKELIIDVAQVCAAATVTIDDINLAKALEALKTLKPKIKGIVIKDHEEPSESRITTRISSKKSQDKERIQAEEQQELNEEEKAKLFMELLEKRIKFFAAKRAEEKINRPPIKAQQRSIVYIYLKNIKGYKLNSLKNKSFADIQGLFDKAMKIVNTFVNYTTELVEKSSKKVEVVITHEESLKRARDELEQETAKKQKIVDDKEIANLKQLVKIILEEDIAIDVIPLAVKTLIVDWKIYKEGKKSYY
nr:hypothetical protein [Tanacetum cinerariifolium]